MKLHTSQFKENIKSLGRELDTVITYGENELTAEELNYIKPRFNTELFKTSMKVLEFDNDVKLDPLQWIDLKIGIKVGEEYEYLDYGDYYINDEPEYNADTESYIHKAYDKMIESMVFYDKDPLVVEYPITYKNYLIAICNKLNWTYQLPATFPNMNTEIIEDLYIDLGLTYRDILDDICPASMGNFINDGTFKIIYPTETGDTIDDEFLKADNVTIGNKTGPINSLVLSRAEDGDTINRRDGESIEENGLQELKIKDNILLSTPDRVNFIDDMFNQIKGFEYYSIDVASTGVMYYELLDRFTINHNSINYSTIALNSELNIEDGIEELLYTPQLEETTTDYSTSSQTDKAKKMATIVAHKNQAKIVLLTQQTDENSTQLSQITQTVDSITTTIEQDIPDLATKYNTIIQDIDQLNISIGMKNGTNLIRNSAMKSGYDYWLKEPWLSYVSADEPPHDPFMNMWWYCTENINGYERGIFYRWNGTTWEKTTATKATFGSDNLLENVEYSENEYARQNTISGSIITFNGKTDYSVSHIFCLTSPIDIVGTQDYVTVSHLLKNNLNTGVIYMGVAFLPMYIEDLRNIDENEVASIYEAGVLLTPDDFTDLTKIERVIKIPKKEDVINVITSATSLVDTTKIWLDTNINLPKQYVDGVWTILEDRNSLLDQNGFIWTYRAFFYGYYQTSYTLDDFIPKVAYCFFTFYPTFTLAIQDTEPTPYKGLCWADNSEGGTVKRPKYNDGEFVEWVETGFPTSIILANPLPSPPYPGLYAMPLNGNYIIADLKLEYGKISSPWTGHPEELYTKNFKFDNRGLTIRSAQNEMYIDEDEINATFNGESIFSIFKDAATFSRTNSKSANIADIEITNQIIDGDSITIEF